MSDHTEKRFVPYSPAQIFDLVIDVERYPEFLPWCLEVQIVEKQDQYMIVDLEAGLGFLKETFRSRVSPVPHERVEVTYEKGPLRYLTNRWEFEPATQDGRAGCTILFHIDFEFKNPLFQGMMGMFFDKALKQMLQAFEHRARILYDNPSPASQPTYTRHEP